MQMATTIGTMPVSPQTMMVTGVPPVVPPSIPPPRAARAQPGVPPPEASRPPPAERPPPGPLRRQSGLPLPVRPSTPLRVQTPTTPVRPVGRGNGSAESTLLSSVHSTFSVASTASSFSSVEGEGSPVAGKRDLESVLGAPDGMVGKDGARGRERERAVAGSEGRERTVVMTWAERARRG